MHFFAVLLAGIVGFTLFAPTSTSDAQQRRQRLTCSMIQKECISNCARQANKDFCISYCGVTHAGCMSTGRWDGTYRQFRRVIRK